MSGGDRVYAHDSSLNNVVNGLMTRLYMVKDGQGGFAPTPTPAPGAWKRMGVAMKRLQRNLPKLSPWTMDEFVNSYHGDQRQRRYADAANDLRFRPVTRKDAQMDTFIKTEKLYKLSADARLIQPRNARYNVRLGRFIKQAEPLISPAIARLWGQTHTVTKGLNALDTGRLMSTLWSQFKDPVAVGLDASRFDQHCSVQALAWEHRAYTYMFSNNPELRKLLSWQLRNSGRAYTSDGYKVSYERKGSRMSGDMNTGIGNCIIMSCMVWAYAQSHSLNCRLVNNGDDCVLFLDRHDLHKLDDVKPWFSDLGYTMTVEDPCYELETIEFCRCHPVLTSRGWTMVRNFPNSMSRDAVVIKKLPTIPSYGHWLKSVAEGGLALTSGVPVLSAYYSMLLGTAFLINPKARTVNDSTLRSGMSRMSRGMADTESVITDEARLSFAAAFSISPDVQIKLEQAFTPHYTNTMVRHGHPSDSAWTSTARFEYIRI